MRHFIFTIIFLLIAVNSFSGNLSPIPTDTYDKIAASGSAIKTWWDSTTTDGDMHEVLLPSGTECKAVLLQVVNSTATNYDPISFHYSSTGGAAADWVVAPESGIIINIGKTTGSLGFVRAATGYKVAILVLY